MDHTKRINKATFYVQVSGNDHWALKVWGYLVVSLDTREVSIFSRSFLYWENSKWLIYERMRGLSLSVSLLFVTVSVVFWWVANIVYVGCGASSLNSRHGVTCSDVTAMRARALSVSNILNWQGVLPHPILFTLYFSCFHGKQCWAITVLCQTFAAYVHNEAKLWTCYNVTCFEIFYYY